MAESTQGTNTPNQDTPTLSEAQIQASMVRWYNNTYCLAHHSPRHIIFSVPNGGTRNALEATSLKAQGLLPGVSDIIIVRPNRTLYVEVKTRTGKQSKEQIAFMQRVQALGHVYVLVRSLDEFKSFIESTL